MQQPKTRSGEISDAKGLAEQAAKQDPFPDLPPSLLSASHIAAYIRVTGMLDVFDEGALKSASYEVKLRGEVIWWDDKGKQSKYIDGNTPTLELLPNSITFVQVEPYFRLPPYIAIRFNLRIHHVHRGLLLGTGPLVDPGFEGRLLIPLHNLTDSAYVMDLREALIWIEFTKTSHKLEPRKYGEKSFPERGKNIAPDEYLRRANANFPIRSSIPAAQTEALRRSEKAQRAAQKAKTSLRRIQTFGFIALLSAVIGVAAIIYSSLNLVRGLSDAQSAISTRVGVIEGKLSGGIPNGSTTTAPPEVNELRQRVLQLEQRLNQSQGPSSKPK